MNWSDERYVRLYTRDTVDWLSWSWQAQALFCLLLRKADRLGEIDLGRHGTKGIAAHVKMPWKVAEPALAELLADSCIQAQDRAGRTVLVFRNYTTANEAIASGAERQRRYRERRHGVTGDGAGDETSPRDVTGDVTRNAVTVKGDAVTSRVTPIRAVPSVPCRADPDPVTQTSQGQSARGRARAPGEDKDRDRGRNGTRGMTADEMRAWAEREEGKKP